MGISPQVQVGSATGHGVLMQDAMDLLFESTKDGLEEEDYWEDSFEMDELISRVQCMLRGGGQPMNDSFSSALSGGDGNGDDSSVEVDDTSISCSVEMMSTTNPANAAATAGASSSNANAANANANATAATVSKAVLKKLDECYKFCDEKAAAEDQKAEFNHIEGFILEEQNTSRERRATSRQMEASEETRLAVEVAQLKGLRLKSKMSNGEDDLRWRTSDAERSYISRKMVYAKASQVAGSEFRVQFASVRDFLEQLHKSRQQTLYRQHRRALNFQALMHALKKSDVRVVALDRQIALRLYRKKKADLIESHMKQTMLEAEYIESMMNALDKVQNSKATAARELFDQHVANLKTERQDYERRQDDIELFAASGTLEMAKLLAQYTAEDVVDQESIDKVQQKVDTMERDKAFDSYTQNGIMSVSKIYDTVIWSVTSNDLGLSSTGSSLYDSSESGSLAEKDPAEHIDENDGGQGQDQDQDVDPMDTRPDEQDHHKYQRQHQRTCMTPVGRMHSRQLARGLRSREKALLKKHDWQVRSERHAHQKKLRSLKAKHQAILDIIVETSLTERVNLREKINERMLQLTKNQEETTEQMKRKDLQLMRETLFEEDQRIQEAETSSFSKAQELISAQVFHEVRNALSSVIAMSEMTTSLKADDTLTPEELVNSVDSMLDQIGDVVEYSLKMLNEILDVSKINSGAFVPKTEAFDLKDIVSRATRMQQAKATRIKMSFHASPQPCIALSDSGIVERVVATLISNAVKFTKNGAVQPFIWPLEDVEGKMQDNITAGSIENGTSSSTQEGESATASMSTESTLGSKRSCGVLQLANKRLKFVAVGVADTGHGLTTEVLEGAKFAISTSTSKVKSHGAQNTGFGLYHAHLQTRALHSNLRLSSLEDCNNLLNEDMRTSLSGVGLPSAASREGSVSLKKGIVPGKGTILYFSIPVYEDYDGAEKALQHRKDANILANRSRNKTAYVFRPLPAPAENGKRCFRILVADDVMMLRKGMVHTIGKLWTQHFPDCPVSVSTACTAEDVLRASRLESYDLIICDHHFNHEDSGLQRITLGDPAANQRPTLRCDFCKMPPEQARKDVRNFFKEERFTVEEGDGSLLGLSALTRIAESSLVSVAAAPVLMLVSGHKLDVEPRLGIINIQKPFKHSDFIASLEKSAPNLYQVGRVGLRECKEDKLEQSSSHPPSGADRKSVV